MNLATVAIVAIIPLLLLFLFFVVLIIIGLRGNKNKETIEIAETVETTVPAKKSTLWDYLKTFLAGCIIITGVIILWLVCLGTWS